MKFYINKHPNSEMVELERIFTEIDDKCGGL